jgi:hypothetical protein
MKELIDAAVETIESAANGISGAGMVADVTYAKGRHKQLVDAAKVLKDNKAGVDAAGIVTRANEMLGACERRDIVNLNRLNIEIGDILAPLCD